ncbi:MAG: GIY-YIG nuclease family protein [Nitrospira sp.]
MFYVYVLKNKSNNFYTGYTSNLKRRFVEHNQGLNLSTKKHKPWVIIYYECCLDESDAKRRERYLKTTQGGRLLKRRLKNYLYKERSKDLTS